MIATYMMKMLMLVVSPESAAWHGSRAVYCKRAVHRTDMLDLSVLESLARFLCQLTLLASSLDIYKPLVMIVLAALLASACSGIHCWHYSIKEVLFLLHNPIQLWRFLVTSSKP